MRSQIAWYAFQLGLTALLVWMIWQSGVTLGDNGIPIANVFIIVYGFVWVTTVYLSYFFSRRSGRSKRNRSAD